MRRTADWVVLMSETGPTKRSYCERWHIAEDKESRCRAAANKEGRLDSMQSKQDSTNELPCAVMYLRFSHDPGGSRIAAARALCIRRANELGARVVAEYIDIGPDLTYDRNQLRLMLDDIAPGDEIDYVIVPDHAAIAKDMHVYTRVAWRIQQAKAKLVAASSPLDQYQAMCAHPLGLMQAVADWANEEGGVPGNSQYEDDQKSNNKEVELD